MKATEVMRKGARTGYSSDPCAQRFRNASLMSLVAIALRRDLDVGMYLESVLTHIVRGTAKTEELLTGLLTKSQHNRSSQPP